MAGDKTRTITLGGQQYTIHKFNIGELERVAEIVEGPTSRTMAFKILKLALARAEPKIANPDAIEADDPAEIRAAIDTVMDLAGLKMQEGKGDENPPLQVPVAS